MVPFKFVHAADLHLDSPFQGLAGLPAAVRACLKQSTFEALGNLVELAIRERVDFVLVAGDVYDLADRSLRAQLRFQKAALRLQEAGIALYLVHGNHDPADGRAARLQWPDNVTVFGTDRVETVNVLLRDGRRAAQLHGISYPTAAVTDNYAKRFPVPADRSCYQIGLLHTNVEGEEGHANYAPCTRQDLERAGMNYWALGHVHTRRTLGEAPWIVYPGNAQGRSIRETGAKGCYVVEVAEDGQAALTFHAVDAVRWERLAVDIERLQTEEELREAVRQAMEQARAAADGRPVVVRLELTGRGPLHPVLQRGHALKELLEELREGEVPSAAGDGWTEEGPAGPFVWLESVRVRTGVPADLARLAAEDSFAGDLVRLADSLLDDEEAFEAFCREALAPLGQQSKLAGLLGELPGEERAGWLRAAREMALDSLLDEEGTA
ncbi:exonuclease SbcCD subunit D [Paenibacillus sp. J31TS4]|uniref:metallophosphoesterase family protein n=1 Tax=Paenibacillus sp. J31TS4 TaxID=2807195 RepID=UPI001B0F4D36|nr:DNA repair exonuclease [Paenibacillus sp. J31TS4]GIP37952.1 exonuclease SbcCD subunit D [Paenibacillus sp. J31TS4]